MAAAVQLAFGLHQVFTAQTYARAPDAYANLANLPPQWYDRSYFNASVATAPDEATKRPTAFANARFRGDAGGGGGP